MLKFHNADDLLDRLANEPALTGKTVVFLLGSALSAKLPNSRYGVPMAAELVDNIAAVFGDNSALKTKLVEELAGVEQMAKYQVAFDFLIGRRGQDVANKIVFDAVCQARTSEPFHFRHGTGSSERDYAAGTLEKDLQGWHVNEAVESLATLASQLSDNYGRTILTSNFDPLLEVAFERIKAPYFRTVLTNDGYIGQTEGPGTHIVHFHGYWYGADTLHTTRQLQQNRPKLKASLSRLINNSIVVVIGYGGWDDVLTRALVDAAKDSLSRPDILWTFHRQSENQIEKIYAPILASLEPGLDRGRVTLFKGIDCHTFFPKLERDLLDRREREPAPIDSRQTTLRLVGHDALFGSDSPPHIDVWVGRHRELRQVSQECGAVFITGIGGQGKSALAARHLGAEETVSAYDFIDWRDCREERDTLHSQLLKILERATAGDINATDLSSQPIEVLAQVLGRVLSTKRCLIVFDNVDNYIDLETCTPVKGLEHVVNEAVKYNRQSKLILTCRPKVNVESVNCISIALQEGLSLDETMELFDRRGVKTANATGSIARAHGITKGHPLWLNLIATQVARKGSSLDTILTAIEQGHGELPEKTLRSIWQTLNRSQQTVLRVMAEMIRPETEERVGHFVKQYMNWNRIDRSVRALRSLNLLVVKQRSDLVDLLDLHPLVKRFVQQEFPRREQDRFVNSIITYIDEQIGKLKSALQRQPSLDILDNWLQMAELDIKLGRLEEALNTLYEVASPLLLRGYPEEFVRVTRNLFDGLDWDIAYRDYTNFNNIFNELLDVLCQLGEAAEVDRYLERYLETIPGKSADYINYCNLRAYSLWFRDDFSPAIEWGEKGNNLKKSSGVDTNHDCEHNLALALRDAGRCSEALDIFLEGKELTAVVDSEAPGKDQKGSFFGNVGRCLHLMGQRDSALSCYKKSLALLSTSKESNRHLNEGYAKFWIGQALFDQGDRELASDFLESARVRWLNISPPRAAKVQAYIGENLSQAEMRRVERMNDYEREERIRDWLNA